MLEKLTPEMVKYLAAKRALEDARLLLDIIPMPHEKWPIVWAHYSMAERAFLKVRMNLLGGQS